LQTYAQQQVLWWKARLEITPRPRYNATSIRSSFRRKSKEKPPMPPIKATTDEIQIFLDEQPR